MLKRYTSMDILMTPSYGECGDWVRHSDVEHLVEGMPKRYKLGIAEGVLHQEFIKHRDKKEYSEDLYEVLNWIRRVRESIKQDSCGGEDGEG